MQCAICKKPIDESTCGQPGSVFPFCSKRCQTIDLARWLDGKYQIPVTDDADVYPRVELNDSMDGDEDGAKN